MLRWLLVEAAQKAAQCDPALRQDYQRLKFRRGHAVAKVAIARKLAVRMYWILRSGAGYAPLVRMQGDRKSTRLNSSHGYISYAVFCLKKKKSSGVNFTYRVPPTT